MEAMLSNSHRGDPANRKK